MVCKGIVIDTKQKSLEQIADTRQDRNDAHSVRFSSIGKESTVPVVDMFSEQDQRGPIQEIY